MSRSPPVLAMSTSRPAPPTATSCQLVCVSGDVFWLLAVSSTSSALSRSLPQPPHIVSWPVPPTSQSFPKSPKIASLPSLAFSAYDASPTAQVPPLVSVVQPPTVGPSVLLLLRNHSTPVVPSVALPVASSRIRRIGLYSS